MTVDEALAQAIRHHQAGDLANAERLYRAILAIQPRHVDANHNLGLIGLRFGHAEAALPHLQAAVAAQPDIPLFHNSLGEAHYLLRQWDQAAAAFRKAVRIDPAMANALMHLGICHHERGDLDKAMVHYRKAIAAKPDYADAILNLAKALTTAGRIEEARTMLERCLAIAPGMAQAHFDLGSVLYQQGLKAEAAERFRKSIELSPAHVESHLNLGNILMTMGLFDEAIDRLRQAAALGPRHPLVHNSLGLALKDVGRAEDAIPHFRKAIELAPRFGAAHKNLLLSILYRPSITPEERFGEHRRFEESQARPLYPAKVRHANSRIAGRRLRVGYLSSDFYNHPVGHNLLPVIEAHDSERIEPCLYAQVPVSDEITARFRAKAGAWRDTTGLSDEAVAGMIRKDAIDILVTVAGRFDSNRPLVAAYRPAPIQVSYWDAATSGMEVMDAFLTDRFHTPRHGTELFTERPIRLPSLYVRHPLTGAPDPVPPPLLANGYPTFGSFNNPAKLSAETLSLWAGALTRIPQARLRLRYKDWFESRMVRDRVIDIMRAHAIEESRLDFEGRSPDHCSFLSAYNAIDIALDTLPFNGATTSFEALWMGVPVVTMLGDTFMSRWTAAMLRTLGLQQELVATTPEGFAELCAGLCSRPDRLVELRSDLRRRMTKSPMCNPRLRARQVERAYRALWRQWCDRHDR